jgi:hypothetical protein
LLGDVVGEIVAELFELTLSAPGFSSECSISLPRIYNMSVAERARFRFSLQPAQQPPNRGPHSFDAVPGAK